MDASARGVLINRLADLIERDHVYIAVIPLPILEHLLCATSYFNYSAFVERV